MKVFALSIYDEKAECFGQPFFTSALGIATRMFTEWVNNRNSMMGSHPGDFTLYHVGFWRDNDAKFETLDVPAFIAKGTEYVRKEKTNV